MVVGYRRDMVRANWCIMWQAVTGNDRKATDLAWQMVEVGILEAQRGAKGSCSQQVAHPHTHSCVFHNVSHFSQGLPCAVADKCGAEKTIQQD